LVKVKPLAQIEKNYRDASGTAASRYKDSIPGITWQAEAVAGQELYEERMSDPSVLARRETGIAKVSDAEFKKALTEKGAAVIGARMRAAAPKMASGYAPIRSALEGLTLPARVADPMANIDARLKPVVQTMIDAAEK